MVTLVAAVVAEEAQAAAVEDLVLEMPKVAKVAAIESAETRETLEVEITIAQVLLATVDLDLDQTIELNNQ